MKVEGVNQRPSGKKEEDPTKKLDKIYTADLQFLLQKYFKRTQLGPKNYIKAIKGAMTRKYHLSVKLELDDHLHLGASLVYQLPTVVKNRKVAFVITTSLDVAEEEIKYLRSLHIPAASFHSSVEDVDRRKILLDMTVSNPTKMKLIYAQPKQVVTQQMQHMMEFLMLIGRLGYIVVKEGERFEQCEGELRDDYRKLRELKDGGLFCKIPWIIITTTAEKRN